MVAIGDSKVNIEWRMNVAEGSFELKPVSTESLHNRLFEKILKVFRGWKSGFIYLCKILWQHGADDPRRFFHSVKVGISLVLVSLYYFITPLYHSTGDTATWAVMTVVVIFEYTAGATLCKGLNRMIATLSGGVLAYVVNVVARMSRHKAEESIIIGVAVFIFSMLATFARVFPKIKARYDYGFLIFTLTFSFIAVSGSRETNIFKSAYERLETIIIGCVICMLTSLLIWPVWAGEDLHKLIINNMEKLAGSLEGCVTEYFKESPYDDGENDAVSIGYRNVLNSKANEESLANFARWEYPAHGQFRFRHPWNQYVRIGARMRYCAYCVEALNVCLNSEIQPPHFLRETLKTPCMNIVTESSKVIRELADSIKTMTRSTDVDIMTDRLNRAVEELHNCLTFKQDLFIDSKSSPIGEETQLYSPRKANEKPIISRESDVFPPQVFSVTTDDSAVAEKNKVKQKQKCQGVAFINTLPLAKVACLLTEIVPRLQTLIMAVDELGELANFQKDPAKFPGSQQFQSSLETSPAGVEFVVWRWSV